MNLTNICIVVCYFSDISDHNSQVIELGKDIKSQTNDSNNYGQNSSISSDSEINGEGRTSKVNRNNTGSELITHVTSINENNTVQTQVAGLQRVFVNEKSVLREFGFMPGKIPKNYVYGLKSGHRIPEPESVASGHA